MEHLPIERRVRLSPAAGSPRPAVGKRSCRLLIIGLCRTKFANFIGSWARRRWKRRFSKRPSNTPQGQKNNCGCRRRRRRTVPDEDRGRGNRRLPLQSCGPSPGTVQEADRSAPATGRRTGVQDQGGHRRAGDLRLSAGPRRSQAAGALAAGLKPPNHKRVYRVMKVHGLLLDRHVGGDERRHDGRIAVDERNRRWCSDGFEIGCDNGERVRVAFALDCCDREAMSFLATTGGIAGEDVRDLMVAAVEYRFGQVNRLPVTIEWLSDNGSCYVAGHTRSFARDIGLEPRTTPLESPQSNGMAEAFVRTIKRDYVRVSPRPDAETVMRQLPAWIAHYNEVHPHKALGYRSPREFIAAHARP